MTCYYQKSKFADVDTHRDRSRTDSNYSQTPHNTSLTTITGTPYFWATKNYLSYPITSITHSLGHPPRGMRYEGFDCNLFTQGDLLTMTVTDTSCYVDDLSSTYDYLDITGLLGASPDWQIEIFPTQEPSRHIFSTEEKPPRFGS